MPINIVERDRAVIKIILFNLVAKCRRINHVAEMHRNAIGNAADDASHKSVLQIS